jgi:NADPH:quinone reductase-like Zn-dependent oxidoreductase
VIAATSRPEHALRLGAHETVPSPEALDAPVDLVIDTVGGPTLVAAFERLAPGGSLQSVGWSSGEPAVLAPYSTFAPAKSLSTFADADAVGDDLRFLAGLVASGRLRVEVGWTGAWERLDEAADALAGRRIVGKAVLHVTP